MDDTYQIRLIGTAEAPTPLDDTKSILVAGEFEITDISKKPNQDGSYTYTYKLYPVRLAKVEETGEKIRLKTKNSNSKRIRGAVFAEQQKRPHVASIDFDNYYDQFTDNLIAELPTVLELLKL